MIQVLPGFREFYPEDCARRNHLFSAWERAAQLFGFKEYDIPTLEPLELFTLKSGDEIIEQLFNFVDKGDRAVTLRPELTPSLARMVGSRAGSLRKPVKWFNIAENFRYERPSKGRLRSHYQFNADIFGEPGPLADAELIGLAVRALREAGLRAEDFRLRLSDRVLWVHFLSTRLVPEEALLPVLSVIDKMERNPREWVEEQFSKLLGDGAATVLREIDTLVTLRSLGSIRDFLAETEASQVSAAMDQRLADWQELLGTLEQFGILDQVQVDLGIVRGLAYYTGFVWEAFALKDGEFAGRALAGGGRYDNLVEKLGFQPIPAAGFGMGDVTVADLLEERGLFPPLEGGADVFMVTGGLSERAAAMADAARLREAGISVEYPLKPVGFGKQFRLADQSGSRFALIYGSEEIAAGSVRLRSLQSGEEELVASTGLVERLGQLLAK